MVDKRLPRGVTTDKERNAYRATYKGWSVRCPTVEDAVKVRKELKARGPHPSYVERRKRSSKNG